MFEPGSYREVQVSWNNGDLVLRETAEELVRFGGRIEGDFE